MPEAGPDGAAPREPVVLTLLAPADRCNQRCPACILDRIEEPVRQFHLTPADYACFVEQFVAASIPILSVSFQGYEVTLPSSWPYVEAAFAAAQRHGVPRDFITNGMLLSKWTERVVALDPQRISISIDGADPATNDSLRGIEGALDATLESIRRLIRLAPQLRDRLAVVSTLYPSRNHASLLAIPSLLRALRIPRWGLGWELHVVDGEATSVASRSELLEQLRTLAAAAVREGIEYHVSDDFAFLGETTDPVLNVCRPYRPELVIRMDPLGYVRSGRAIARVWSADEGHRWDPTKNAPRVARYFEKVAKYRGTWLR